MDAKLSPAMENYIKTIYRLEKENKVARVSDIGKRLNVKKASVVSAVTFLGKMEFLTHEKYGYINLTENGRGIAESLQKKNSILYNFLTSVLKVDEETARLEACEIEHDLSDATVAKFSAFMKSVKKIAAISREKRAKIQKSKKKSTGKKAKSRKKRSR